MPRSRWLLAGFLVVATVVSGLLNARGPFDAHPALAYDQFLADFQAGEVEQIVQWQDQLEVTEQHALRSVTVPPDRDLTADLALARVAGGVGLSYARLPDSWLIPMTPWVALLITLAAVVIWVTSVTRSRRLRPEAGPNGSAQPAG